MFSFTKKDRGGKAGTDFMRECALRHFRVWGGKVGERTFFVEQGPPFFRGNIRTEVKGEEPPMTGGEALPCRRGSYIDLGNWSGEALLDQKEVFYPMGKRTDADLCRGRTGARKCLGKERLMALLKKGVVETPPAKRNSQGKGVLNS